MNLFPSFRRAPGKDADDAIAGERDSAAVNKDLALPARIARGIGIGGVGAASAWFIWHATANASAQHDQDKAPAQDAQRASTEPRPLPALLPEPAPAAAAPRPAAAPLLAPLAPPAPTATNGAAPPLSPQEALLKRRLESPLSFETGGAAPDAAATVASGAAGAATRLAQAARPDGARPYLLPHPSMTVARGTVIPCTVQAALDTTLRGEVNCVQSADVWSVDGKVKLLEKGSTWTGLQGNGVAQGQHRVGIVWTRGLTPNNVVIPVDANATDALGRPGMPGEIDTHFWDRFSAAIMLSLVSDIGPALAASRSGGNNNTTIAFPTITSGAQDVVAQVLKTTLDIPPTLTAPQAGEILIYANQDIDLSDIYALKATQ